MATLINGDGNVAVYAAQDADWFAGVEGNVTKILNIGLKMAYEIEDANTIAVKNGVIVTKEGRRIQVDAGSIDEFTIPTGAQGVTKYYIIGYHLYTDASSNQLCETFVQLMANDTDTIPEDTFRGGSDEVYVSLYRVTQDGITLSTVQSLLPEAATIKDIEDDIAGINASLTELIRHTESTSQPGTVEGKTYISFTHTVTEPQGGYDCIGATPIGESSSGFIHSVCDIVLSDATTHTWQIKENVYNAYSSQQSVAARVKVIWQKRNA